MKRKLIASAAVTAMLCQFLVPVYAADTTDTVLNDTFDGDTSGYFAYYSATEPTEVSVENGRLKGVFGGSDEFNTNDGVMKDITELVETDSKYEVSADFETTWWGETAAKLFFEVQSSDGATEQIAVSDALGEGQSGAAVLSGTADLRFDDGDTVYLCVTQGAGTQYYDNILVTYVGVADSVSTPDVTSTPEPTEAPAENAIFTDDFSDETQADKYGLYVEYTDADAGISVSGGKLTAAMGANNGWSATNGIRRDITDEVSEYISGLTFGAHIELNAYWNSDAVGKIFFEVVSAGGIVTVTDIADFPIPDDENGTATAEGTAQLNFSEGDTVYLCATQMSGNHYYDNISLWLENGDDGAITLTSGTKYGGTFFPETADVIYSDTFSGGDDVAAKYTSCNSVPFKEDPILNNGGAMFQFPDGEGSVHGVAVDVTEAFDNNIPNGGTVRVSCKMLPWWWWGSVSVKLRIDGKTTNIADYTSKTDEPDGTWTTVGGTADIERNLGDKTEVIIAMNSGSATGFTIDDVCVELPYDTVMARDIAVASAAKLANIGTVDIVYGGSYVTSGAVKWGAQSGNIVYGETDIDGVTARAYITDGNVKKVTVTPSGVTVSDYTLEAGKTAKASGDDEMVFLLDDIADLNLLSAVSGTGVYALPQSGTTDRSAQMSVSDNGNGVTVEGTVLSAAYNDEVIFIKDSSGNPVAAEYVYIDADGKYSAVCGVSQTGKYTAAMTDTGVSAEFSYAAASDFEVFRSKVSGGQSVGDLLKDENNRVILGAGTYQCYDTLSESAQAAVCEAFTAQIGDKTRAEAAALFDALVTIQAAASDISESEWTQMLEASAEELDIKDTSIYNQYLSLSQDRRESVKSKTAAQNPTDTDSFIQAFSGAVVNTRLVNAGNYTNVQSILKENADLFDGTDVSNLSASAAKYINSNISENDITIDSLVSLIKEAKSSAKTSTGSSGGGGGGSSGSSSSGSSGTSGIAGTNVGLSISQNEETGNTLSALYTDLYGCDWAQSAIYALTERGIINGYGDGTFNPGGNITREEFVKIIVSAFGISDSDAPAGFADLSSDRWSYDAINAAAAAKVVTGISDTEFAPTANITRQDAAVMLYRALLYKGRSVQGGALSFTDSADIADYAAEGVAALSQNGVINGMDDGSFAPSAFATRAQTAVMVFRVIETLL